jgi:hypothetical protein
VDSGEGDILLCTTHTLSVVKGWKEGEYESEGHLRESWSYRDQVTTGRAHYVPRSPPFLQLRETVASPSESPQLLIAVHIRNIPYVTAIFSDLSRVEKSKRKITRIIHTDLEILRLRIALWSINIMTSALQ